MLENARKWVDAFIFNFNLILITFIGVTLVNQIIFRLLDFMFVFSYA